MAYKVEFRPEAAEDLRHLDKAIAQRVLSGNMEITYRSTSYTSCRSHMDTAHFC